MLATAAYLGEDRRSEIARELSLVPPRPKYTRPGARTDQLDEKQVENLVGLCSSATLDERVMCNELIRSLSLAESTALILKVCYDFTPAEVAESLRTDTMTARRLIFRAMLKARKLVGNRGN